jgi:type IV pilus assembly protein PilV
MRANLSKAADYPGKAAAVNAACYSAAGCSPDAMAGNDMYEWNQSLATLPAGQGSITALGGGLYTITVMWDEQRNGATGTNCDPNDDSDLRCVSLTTQP